MQGDRAGKYSLCPSARPVLRHSVVFGVVGGTVDIPRIVYLKQVQRVTEALIAKVQPVTPTEVFRTASTCETKRCQHFDGSNCRLASQVAEKLPAVAVQLPPCAIRRDCQWWQQEGNVVCFRCPQVITDHYDPSDLMKAVSIPISA